jgi:hypothetical protein
VACSNSEYAKQIKVPCIISVLLLHKKEALRKHPEKMENICMMNHDKQWTIDRIDGGITIDIYLI